MKISTRRLRRTIRRVIKESMHSQMDAVIKNIVGYACQEAAAFMRNFGHAIVFEELNAMSDQDIISSAGYSDVDPERDKYLVQAVRTTASDKNELKRVLFELVDEGLLVHNRDGSFGLGNL